MHSAIPKRIQAVITINGGITKCNMTCQIFAGNEISFKIECFVVTVLYTETIVMSAWRLCLPVLNV